MNTENKEVRKLELCDIVPYLSYGLNAKLSHTGLFNLDLEYPVPEYTQSGVIKDFAFDGQEFSGTITVDPKFSIDFYGCEEIEIMLRPLDQLTQEITHNGETFIPIIRLAAIACASSKIAWDVKDGKAKHINSEATFHLSYDNSFIYKESRKWKDFGVPCRQLELFQKLYEWHFDLNGLLSSGLAIPIHNTK